ncbi:NAD(P)H-dependent oxidoreductase [Phaeobacter sp. PT47_59]|uniref:NAD(P)H-dependent oxidoreductase n=1 Tax=Phaeobacter sp. PT47_59 TaxID=3029979 RepID=UPI00237FE325|nr:NAD(P)H-dependent oxidoreductase [Phaeobacter sp. PT47_59]MDE4175344.1 NAD(P)H-dependent oxidoreductase [Phaeobacter sp. PT47_59]
MRVLVVYAHPRAQSYNAAIRDLVMERIKAAGAEARLIDLYASGFEPRLSAQGLEFIEDEYLNQKGVEEHCEALKWCDTLIFVYPTWWYGLPAMLKGWLDRVLVSGVAFHLPPPEGGDIRPALTHITRLGVFTTCGASRHLTWFIGAPGRRTLLRGLRLICARTCRTAFAAHYRMDSSTPESRARHLKRVGAKVDRLLRA